MKPSPDDKQQHETPRTDAVAPHLNLSHADMRKAAGSLRDLARVLEAELAWAKKLIQSQADALEARSATVARVDPVVERCCMKFETCKETCDPRKDWIKKSGASSSIEPPIIFSAGTWTYSGDGRDYDSRELDAAAWHKLNGARSARRRITRLAMEQGQNGPMFDVDLDDGTNLPFLDWTSFMAWLMNREHPSIDVCIECGDLVTSMSRLCQREDCPQRGNSDGGGAHG